MWKAKHKVLVGIGVAIIVFVAIAAVVSMPSVGTGHYAVTVVNRGSSTILEGSVSVQGRSHAVPRLEPGRSIEFSVPVRSDDDYRVRFVRSSGVELADTLGYVTNGVAIHDTIRVFEAKVDVASGP